MKTLVSTKNTFISADEKGNLFTNQSKPLGITLQELKKFKSSGGVVGFPFSRIDLSEIEDAESYPIGEFYKRGALNSIYNVDVIESLREEYKISPFLSYVKFYDVKTLKLKNVGYIFTLHNGVNMSVSFDYSFEEHIQNVEERKRLKERNYNEFLIEQTKQQKGWYIVTITGTVMRHKGNDGNKTVSIRTLAESKMNAYENAIKYCENNQIPNVMLWQIFEPIERADIDFIGIWQDEDTLMYGDLID